MHTHVLPWTDRPLVTQNLVGGEEGISDAGLSVSRLILEPVMFLEATGEVYRRRLATSSRREARRPDLRRPPARLSRPHRGTNLDLGGSFALRPQRRRRPDDDHAAVRRRRDVPVPAAAARHLPRFIGPHRAHLEPAGQPSVDFTAKRVRLLRSGDYQFARRWFAAPATTGRSALDDSALARHRRLVRPDLLAERVQPGPRRSTAGHATPRASTANEFLFQFQFSIGAHGAHMF